MNARFVFPIPDLNTHPSAEYGLTKRELFAAMAMANPTALAAIRRGEFTTYDHAKACIGMADALIEELAR